VGASVHVHIRRRTTGPLLTHFVGHQPSDIEPPAPIESDELLHDPLPELGEPDRFFDDELELLEDHVDFLRVFEVVPDVCLRRASELQVDFIEVESGTIEESVRDELEEYQPPMESADDHQASPLGPYMPMAELDCGPHDMYEFQPPSRDQLPDRCMKVDHCPPRWPFAFRERSTAATGVGRGGIYPRRLAAVAVVPVARRPRDRLRPRRRGRTRSREHGTDK